jgi:hypothetical protein
LNSINENTGPIETGQFNASTAIDPCAFSSNDKDSTLKFNSNTRPRRIAFMNTLTEKDEEQNLSGVNLVVNLSNQQQQAKTP